MAENEEDAGQTVRFRTQVSTTLQMNRGTVGHTTFAFIAACAVAAIGSGSAFAAGYPLHALVALAMPFVFCLGYQWITWDRVAKNPDAAMTADRDYVSISTKRIAASKDKGIIQIDEKPVVGSLAKPVDPDEAKQ